ncbi:hypothetical protein [Comamonas odontotermitis]|uniref:hypothetical protein n=1 Tax=Comamonas odontotermitis TaxID=379895 RepID=UPI003753460D
MSKTKDAASAGDTPQGAVHTSAQQPKTTKPVKPEAYQPRTLAPRDVHTGQGGQYVRDPATGIRTKVPATPVKEQDNG